MGTSLKPGSVLKSTYEIIRPLGEGGMGSVYEATHLSMRHSVAIKVLSIELIDIDSIRHRFLEEGQIQAQLRHPNLVHVYDIIEDRNMLAIVMEFVPGRTLRDFIYASDRPVDIDQGVGIIQQVLSGLACAHEVGIIHRDIKPDNIFMAQEQTKLVPKLGDFGIAKDVGAQGVTQFGTMLGTPYYMAPEQAIDGRDVDVRTDIYSLGVMMYELFTQQLPFEDSDYHKIVQAHILLDPERPTTYRPDIIPKLEKVILRCREKEREDRYQTCAALTAALRGLRKVPTTFPKPPFRKPTPIAGEPTIPSVEMNEEQWSEYLSRSLVEPYSPSWSDDSEEYLSKAMAPETPPRHVSGVPPSPLPGIFTDEHDTVLSEWVEDSPPPEDTIDVPAAPAAPSVDGGLELNPVSAPPIKVMREPTPTVGLPPPEQPKRPLTPPGAAQEPPPHPFYDSGDFPGVGPKGIKRPVVASTEEPVFKPSRFDPLKWARLCLIGAILVFAYQAFPFVHCVYEVCHSQANAQSVTYDPTAYKRISITTALEATMKENLADALDLGRRRCTQESGFGHGHKSLNLAMFLLFGGFVGFRLYDRFR